MSAPANVTLGCPACGMKLTGQESQCPRCGKKFDKDLKFECPYCGELILRGATACPSCHLDVSDESPSPDARKVDRKLTDLLDSLTASEAKQVSRDGRRFSCPRCSLLVADTEERCPNCGLMLASLPMLACPECGSQVKRDYAKCPVCFIPLSLNAKAVTPAMVTTPAVATVNESGPPKPPPQPRFEEIDEIFTCPSCGAPTSPTQKTCQKCGTSAVVLIKRPAAPAPATKDVKTGSAEVSLDALYKIAKDTKPIITRKLRTGKVTQVAPQRPSRVSGLSNGVGQINGISKINGSGRTNGTGAVNGQSLVNGTGISNGLNHRSRGGRIGDIGFAKSWQFLTVLLVLVVVLSVFLVILPSKNESLYSVDGQFGDWKKSTMYSASIQSSLASLNITEWSFAANQGDLYLYVKTLSNMMSSDNVENIFLLIDSDGSSATGYLVSDMGADCMMQIYGWNGSVHSKEMYVRSSNADQSDWNSWTFTGNLDAVVSGDRLEARGELVAQLASSARMLLMSESSTETGSVSHTVPSVGGVLIVHKEPVAWVTLDGVVPVANQAPMLNLRFTCEGAGGRVEQVAPSAQGAPIQSSIGPFALEPGQERVFSVSLDTSSAPVGQFVWSSVDKSNISSTFADVEIVGEDASAYVVAPPQDIVIDGAFADWIGRTYQDTDMTPVQNPNLNIDRLGNVSTGSFSYFYVSVEGELCHGTYVPAAFSKPSGTGGGGGQVVPTRRSGEDYLRILIDSDNSTLTGYAVSYQAKVIGADQMIEIKGFDGRVISSNEFNYISNGWEKTVGQVLAAKDSRQIEIGVSAASLGGNSSLEYIVETTDWTGRGDVASPDPVGARGWPVESGLSGADTSYPGQRKIFYDGTNLWSFYYDGGNTVSRYSTDGGKTWTTPTGARPFSKTASVKFSSIWYDSASQGVYVVGDKSAQGKNIYVINGTVNPASHLVNWLAGGEQTLQVSSYNQGSKYAYICKDASGNLWVLAANKTANSGPWDLSVFRSVSPGNVTAWTHSSNMIAGGFANAAIKGSIVPAGTGSQVWAVYTYGGSVASRKFTTSWSSEVLIQTGSGTLNGPMLLSPPSAVVDSRGVVHVVYGNCFENGTAKPHMMYAHNRTGSTAFTSGLDLDPTIPQNEGDISPSISIDASTDNLFAFWIRSDSTDIGNTIMGKKNVSGTWTSQSFASDTTTQKQYLTSIYSSPSETYISWEWTQNTSAFTIEVQFESKIPEFGSIVYPVMIMVAFIALVGRRSKKRTS